jgi:pimeloyl-ACP methyl ester carboxylesterase
VIGHDWGAYIAGRFALWHPDRLLALGMCVVLLFYHSLSVLLNVIFIMIRLSVPFTPPTKEYLSLQDLVKKVPNLAYQLYFANPKLTEEIEANVRRGLCVQAILHVLIYWFTARTIPKGGLCD